MLESSNLIMVQLHTLKVRMMIAFHLVIMTEKPLHCQMHESRNLQWNNNNNNNNNGMMIRAATIVALVNACAMHNGEVHQHSRHC